MAWNASHSTCSDGRSLEDAESSGGVDAQDGQRNQEDVLRRLPGLQSRDKMREKHAPITNAERVKRTLPSLRRRSYEYHCLARREARKLSSMWVRSRDRVCAS
jgi:hypothetical protein